MDAKSKELLGKLEALNGNYDSLLVLKDVQFDYTKVIHGNTRMSKEQLIFKGEHSLSTYKTRNCKKIKCQRYWHNVH